MEDLGQTAAGILEDMLLFQNQVRLYHWGTKIYARHVASGNLYEKMDSFIDKFVEIYMGKFNGGSLKGTPFKYNKIILELNNLNDLEMIGALNHFKAFLNGGLNQWLSDMQKHSNTDLKNLVDDIMGDINKTLYLFTLS
jgi:DNA-binding ferritin-like protein